MDVSDVRREDSDSRAWISELSAFRETSMLLCWAARPGREEVVWERECWRWACRAWARLWRSISFSGLGGMGGAGKGTWLAGLGNVRGSSIRSGGGGGLGFDCMGGGCCH